MVVKSKINSTPRVYYDLSKKPDVHRKALSKQNIINVWNEENKREHLSSIPHIISVDNNLFTAGGTTAFSFISINAADITNGYNAQALKYISTIGEQRAVLNDSNSEFLKGRYVQGDEYSAHMHRNINDWAKVKNLVVRDELMKLQMGGKTDLPLTDEQLKNVQEQISGKDLSNLSDREVNDLIGEILKPNKADCLNAFREFKETGKAGEFFQSEKLEALEEELANIDLDHITEKELKHLMDNYWEKTEIHHRESVSADPTKQNDINNLEALKASDHDAKHTDPETGKINYKKPVKEEMLDREAELERINKERVVKNELKGIGIALAVSAGVGFSLGFISCLAVNGISPETMKNAFITGAKSMGDSTLLGAVSYGVSRTLGNYLVTSVTEVLTEKLATTVSETAFKTLCTMSKVGIFGVLSITVAAIYQFVKLKIQGYSTKECLIRVGKSAAISCAVLALTISVIAITHAQIAGVIVSVACSVVLAGISIGMSIHDKKLREDIRDYMIDLMCPNYIEDSISIA